MPKIGVSQQSLDRNTVIRYAPFMVISREDFISLCSTQSVVSFSETMVLDMETPVTVLSRLKDYPDLVLLEGISEQVKHDRYSYIGFDAYLKITCHASFYALNFKSGKTSTATGNFYDFLEGIMARYSLAKGSQAPFSCGLMGSMSYECVSYLESIPLPQKRSLNTPLATFIVPHFVIIFDNLTHQVSVYRNCFTEDVAPSDYGALYDANLKDLQSVLGLLLAPLSHAISPLDDLIGNYDVLKGEASVDEATFKSQVQRCQEYIKAGDIFQIQVSRRVSLPFTGDPFDLYRYVRNYNPSPLLFYLKFGDVYLMGASPEILVTCMDRKMVIRPLAGTRKRYSKDKTESEIIQELIHDPKEIAEHIMLVDLARNDIARACELGSVKVTELMNTEKYTHVIHMVSEVEGHLTPESTAVDALKYGFPAGTVTGTPKIRAMEIISELEVEQREFYSGGVVFLDFQGDLKSALTIRSMLVTDGRVYTQSAAGIVADSIPEMEFKETNNKMRSCLSAMMQLSDREDL